jgi:hypothetical protein
VNGERLKVNGERLTVTEEAGAVLSLRMVFNLSPFTVPIPFTFSLFLPHLFAWYERIIYLCMRKSEHYGRLFKIPIDEWQTLEGELLRSQCAEETGALVLLSHEGETHVEAIRSSSRKGVYP